jgi:hypothetical protein
LSGGWNIFKSEIAHIIKPDCFHWDFLSTRNKNCSYLRIK